MLVKIGENIDSYFFAQFFNALVEGLYDADCLKKANKRNNNKEENALTKVVITNGQHGS